ncbi:MAG: outer membrane protein transport protein [Smithella sp.]
MVKYKAIGAGPGVVVNDGVTIDSDRGASPVPAFGLIIPINDNLRFGIGAYGIAGMGVDYKYNLYSGVTYTSYSQMRFAPGLSYKINDIVSVGASVNIMYGTKDLIIGFDVQWINWSQTVGENLPKYKANGSGALPWNMDWDDQFVYKVGIQYAVHPMVTLRAGYNYGKMPLNSDRAFKNMAFPAVSEHHITAGIGLNLTKNLTVNVGGMYSPPAKITGANLMRQGIVSYEAEMSQYSIDSGISYTF